VTGLGGQISRLARHSAIYGVGGLASRFVALILLPLYTRYLTPSDYGAVETLVALVAILTTVLRVGIPSAFFRFYFDSEEPAYRTRVIRTSFWFTMAMATIGLAVGMLLAERISEWLFDTNDRTTLVRAAFVLLWAQMNYEQMTALFRVEERAVAFTVASLANLAFTVAATVTFVVALEWGATGVVVGNFTGTLIVYAALLAYRREQLGLTLDRPLLRNMNRFGLPLMPAMLAIWLLNFGDRFFILRLEGADDVGVYSIGARIASAMVLLLTAFRAAWPAFAYSIEEDAAATRADSFVLTYLLFVASWAALALSLLSPWLVEWLTTPEFYDASDVVALLAFGAVAFGGFQVVSIGLGRTKRTQFNWIVTGAAALISVVLNLTLIPLRDRRRGIANSAPTP
jgi:O-antigen/teichoic acid export membrane protein